jgi:hypothetical protein
VPASSSAPVVWNGLQFTPVPTFPREAFKGVPPIVTLSDVQAAARMVRQLSDRSAQAASEGNAELSALSMFWARKYASVIFLSSY